MTVLVESFQPPYVSVLLGAAVFALTTLFALIAIPQSRPVVRAAVAFTLLLVGVFFLSFIWFKSYADKGMALRDAARDHGIENLAPSSGAIAGCSDGSGAAAEVYTWEVEGLSMRGMITKGAEVDGTCKYTFAGRKDAAS